MDRKAKSTERDEIRRHISGRKNFLWTEMAKSIENKWMKRHIRGIIKLPYIKKTNLAESVRANSIKGEERAPMHINVKFIKNVKHIRCRKELSYIQKANSTENEGAEAYEGRKELLYIKRENEKKGIQGAVKSSLDRKGGINR